MKTYLFFILSFLSINSFAQNIDDIIHREMKEKRIPGLQIAVVKDDIIVFSKSYGVANIQDNVPVKKIFK